MARTRISAGLSINDILKMPMSKFGKYTEREQKEIVSRLASAGNKRLRTLERAGVTNPATLKLQMSGGKLSVAGKSGDELQEEFNRAKGFLKSGFSKVRTWNKFVNKLASDIEAAGKTEHPESVGAAFTYYDYLREVDPTAVGYFDKYQILDQIAEYVEQDEDPETIIRRSYQFLEDRYNQRQKEYREVSPPLGYKPRRKRYRRK